MDSKCYRIMYMYSDNNAMYYETRLYNTGTAIIIHVELNSEQMAHVRHNTLEIYVQKYK